MCHTILAVAVSVCLPATLAAQDAIQSATIAAPPSISAEATVVDWSFEVLREGSNGWTCLPDRPDTPYAHIMVPLESRGPGGSR